MERGVIDPRKNRRLGAVHTIQKIVQKMLPTAKLGYIKGLSVVSSGQAYGSDVQTQAHPLLGSDLHSDTVSESPTRGALIIGNLTPRWIKLSSSTIGKFLQLTGSPVDIAWSAWVLPLTAPNEGKFLRDDGTWAIPSDTNYWQCIGVVLSPLTANDNVQVATDEPFAIHGQTSNDEGDAVGVKGEATDPHAICHGVCGEIVSDANAAYGGKFTRTHLGTWADLTEQSSDPANPETGDLRPFAKASPGAAGSRLFFKDDAGVKHDLGVSSKEIWRPSGGIDPSITTLHTPSPNNNHCNLMWFAGKLPEAGAETPGVVYTNQSVFQVPAAGGDTVVATDSFGRWKWFASYVISTLKQQYVILTAGSNIKLGDGIAASCKTACAWARVRINNTTCFGTIKLILSDVDGSHISAYTCSTGGTAWALYTTGPVDVSAYTGLLRVTLVIYGYQWTVSQPPIETRFDVEFLGLEQWPI